MRPLNEAILDFEGPDWPSTIKAEVPELLDQAFSCTAEEDAQQVMVGGLVKHGPWLLRFVNTVAHQNPEDEYAQTAERFVNDVALRFLAGVLKANRPDQNEARALLGIWFTRRTPENVRTYCWAAAALYALPDDHPWRDLHQINLWLSVAEELADRSGDSELISMVLYSRLSLDSPGEQTRQELQVRLAELSADLGPDLQSVVSYQTALDDIMGSADGADLGDPAQVVDAFWTAIGEETTQTSSLVAMGQLAFNFGRTEVAVAAFEAALARGLHNIDSAEAVGMVTYCKHLYLVGRKRQLRRLAAALLPSLQRAYLEAIASEDISAAADGYWHAAALLFMEHLDNRFRTARRTRRLGRILDQVIGSRYRRDIALRASSDGPRVLELERRLAGVAATPVDGPGRAGGYLSSYLSETAVLKAEYAELIKSSDAAPSLIVGPATSVSFVNSCVVIAHYSNVSSDSEPTKVTILPQDSWSSPFDDSPNPWISALEEVTYPTALPWLISCSASSRSLPSSTSLSHATLFFSMRTVVWL
jgi:hypothetical protein